MKRPSAANFVPRCRSWRAGSFWVWIAAVMGVYWEHKAGPAAVAAMEELSAEISGAEQSSVSAKPAS